MKSLFLIFIHFLPNAINFLYGVSNARYMYCEEDYRFHAYLNFNEEKKLK